MINYDAVKCVLHFGVCNACPFRYYYYVDFDNNDYDNDNNVAYHYDDACHMYVHNVAAFELQLKDAHD